MVAKTMKLKSSTIALMAIALLSVGGIYLWDQSNTAQNSATNDKKAAKPLFDLKEADVTQLSIQTKNQILKLKKTAKGWQLIAPQAGPANEGTVTFLLNLLATGTSEQTLQIEPAQLQEFGLEPPTTILALELKNQKSYQVNLGKQNFNQSAVYAQIDKNAAVAPAKESLPPKREIVLVPTGFLDAVNRPLSEWQANASSPNPTVSPSPSATSK
jgi:Domain of unknown function (DUF4340)